MIQSSAIFCALLALGNAMTVEASAWAKPKFSWDNIEYVYAFGDSYTFVGGTRGHANYSFIGDAFNLAFTPSELFTNEIIPKNTSSDGANWVEFLTGCTGGLPSLCKRQLWDFAFAGSDITAALLPLHHNYTASLVEQVAQYVKYASGVLPHPQGKTLTAWWIGINDTGDVVNNSTITDWPAFWEQEMQAYFTAVESAHAHGLSSAHVFLNVPPGDRAPARVGNAATAAIARQRVSEYNAALSTHVARFASAHPETPVLAFDANAFFNSVLDNYAQYGFGNITGYCQCTDPSYFWYNTGHPTEKVHKLLANELQTFLKNGSSALV